MDNSDMVLIDRYLQGELTAQEMDDVTKRISADQEFNNLLNEERKLRRGIEFAALKNMAIRLQDLESSMGDESAPALGRQRQLFGYTPALFKIAATVLLLIGISYVIYHYAGGNDHDSQIAFAEYYTPYPNEVYTLKRGQATVPSEVQKGFYFYDRGEFETAVQYFDQVSKKDDVVVFYQANALMSLNRMEDAQKMLESIVQNQDSVFYIPSKWYLALCYLNTGQISEAVQLLEEIKKTNNTYRDKAAKLLQEIDR